ncbi:MAG TPA: hypothetical protein VFZ25_07330 [Chloroflexota bacterium]|nr:hypothetical protein [Chloroflexota bacterium]
MRQQPQHRPTTNARPPETTEATETLGEDYASVGVPLPGRHAPLTTDGVLRLQRAVGNYAVERYVTSGLISRAMNEDAEEIKKANERIRRLNESRAGQIRIGPDGRPMQPSQIPPRPVPAGPGPGGPGPGGTTAGVQPQTGSVAQDSLKLGEREAAAAGRGVAEERALLQSRFYDMVRKAGARAQQNEVRAKIAAILTEKGLTMAGREGAVLATSEAPPLAVIVQTVVAIQDIWTFGEVVWEIALLLSG